MDWTEQLLAITFVFTLLGGAVWALGRRGGAGVPTWLRKSSRQEYMNCLARMPLTAQHTLHLVTVSGKKILVATHPGGVTIEPQGSPFELSLASALAEDRKS
jgi:flagellar biogenesis protein FliO